MSSFTEGQTHQLMEALEAAGYTPALVTKLGQAGQETHGGIQKVLLGFAEIQIVKRILELRKVLDVAGFVGTSWAIWKGPADGKGLEGEEDRDTCEDGLTEIDLADLLRENCLKEGEMSITGEEKLRRLKESGKIRLGGKTFLALWEDYQKNKVNSMLEHLYKVHGMTYIDFFGLVLRRSYGGRCVLCLYRGDAGQWDWSYYWLGGGWESRPGSASLASSAKA